MMHHLKKLILLYFCLPMIGCSTCNFSDCLYGLNEILHLENQHEFVCGKVNKTANCFYNCLQSSSFMEVGLNNSLNAVSAEMCQNELLYSIFETDQCMSSHIYELLACFMASLNVKALDVNADIKLLKCRRIQEAQLCPEKVLKNWNCSRSSIEAVDEVLYHLLAESKMLYCHSFSMKEVNDLKVVFLSNGRFMKISRCFDENSVEVASCLNIFQHLNFQEDSSVTFCNEKRLFVKCVSSSLEPICGEERVSMTSVLVDSVMSFLDLSLCDDKLMRPGAVTYSAVSQSDSTSNVSLEKTAEHPANIINSDQSKKMHSTLAQNHFTPNTKPQQNKVSASASSQSYLDIAGSPDSMNSDQHEKEPPTLNHNHVPPTRKTSPPDSSDHTDDLSVMKHSKGDTSTSATSPRRNGTLLWSFYVLIVFVAVFS